MQIGELFVRLRGDSAPLDRSLRGAQQSLNRFERGIGGVQKSMVALRANWLALSAAAATVGFALNRVFSAADAFDASQRRLAATAKITGQNLGFLQTVAREANREFSLGASTANEFAIEVSKLTAKAGQIENTGAAIRSLLDLGAGRGLSSTETLQAVQQAILGIDEGTDKLFGKNPSVIYAEFAAKVGLVASKMTDGEKALAIYSAAMEDGGKLAGEYAKFLASPAGETQRLQQRTEDLAAGIGRSMASIRSAALPIWGAIIEEIREFIEEARSIPVHLSVIAARMKVGFGAIADAFGNSISGGQAGRTREQAARQALARVEADAKASLERIGREMNLTTDIVGDTNPLKTFMEEAAAAAERAAEAAKKVREAWARLPAGTETFGISAPTRDRTAPRGTIVDPRVPIQSTFTPGTGRVPVDPARDGALRGFLSGVGDQIKDVVAQFGPLAAVAAALRPVFQGIMDTIGPILTDLAEPLRIVGRLFGAVIAPALRLLEPPLRFLSKVVSYVIEGFGYLVLAIGKAAGGLSFGLAGKGLRKAGEEMIQSARDSRKALDSLKPGVDDFAEGLSKATAQLTNYANVLHINALRFGIGRGGGGAGGTGVRPGGRPAMEIIVNALPGAEVLVKEGGKVVQNVRSRGGTTRFALAT